MPSEHSFDVRRADFRVHGLVRNQYESTDGVPVLDVELDDGTLLSVRDPGGQYPAALVEESRTLSLAVGGYRSVRPAAEGSAELCVSDEGRADIVGRRTAQCSWDGRRVAVPLDVSGTAVDVPIRETERPANEPNATAEILADAGLDDCTWVAVDGARLVVQAVDLDVESDPWSGVVYEDVAVALDLDDDSFRSQLADGNGLALVGFRVRLGDRWFLGNDDQAFVGDFLGIVGQVARCVSSVLDGERASVHCMDAPIEFDFEPVTEETMRVTVTDSRGKPVDSEFPPAGPLVDTVAFAQAVLDAIRRLLAVAWELGQGDNREVEQVREYAVSLRHALADADDD
jgi:hypothetical protein